jgi:hypothetical protein
MQLYEYAHYLTFMATHQRNATLTYKQMGGEGKGENEDAR